MRDDHNLIALNGYILDTTNAGATYDQIPPDLRQSEESGLRLAGASPGGKLYLVQFVGPIQDEWLEAGEGAGGKIVSYIPDNAYIVRANPRAYAALAELLGERTFVQFLGSYEPGFRLSPALQAALREPPDTPHRSHGASHRRPERR